MVWIKNVRMKDQEDGEANTRIHDPVSIEQSLDKNMRGYKKKRQLNSVSSHLAKSYLSLAI